MRSLMKFTLMPGLITVLVLSFSSCSKSTNWPQFRGPDGNMAFESASLPDKWNTDTNVVWTALLDGAGYSSPVVWGNRIFVTSAVPVKVNPAPEKPPMPAGPPPQGGQGQQPAQPPLPPVPPIPEVRDTTYMNEIYKLEVQCFDLLTGKLLWTRIPYEGAPRIGKNANSTYACETPVTDGQRLYASFGMHGIFCYDLEGNPLWNKDLGAFYTQKGWGTGSSPILHNNMLFIQSDNEENSFITALDAATGNEIWRVMRDEKTTYSTPYIWKNLLRTELVTCGKKARSYDPETGKLLWELEIGGEQVIPSPVGNEELLFIGNAGGRETKARLFAVKPGAEGEVGADKIAWMSEDSGLGNPSPLLYRDRLYVIGGRGEISVLDPLTGSVKYQQRINGVGAVWATAWANNDIIYFLDERGVTRAFRAGDSFEKLAENTLEGTKFWSSIAMTGKTYLFKSAEKLYCVGK